MKLSLYYLMLPIVIGHFSGSYPADNEKCTEGDAAWKTIFNQKKVRSEKVYAKNAVLATPDGKVHDTPATIQSFYLQLKKDLKRIKSIESTFCADISPEFSYEIGSFSAAKKQRWKHLVIWNNTGETPRRQLEVLAPASEAPLDQKGIDQARKLWIELCNQHNANQLVSTTYTKNAIYYNHKPVVIGTTDISEEYSYMNREKYRLHLEPLHVESVQENLVFEIGQCSGSYGGKYMLVWLRGEDGVWRVLLDSNK